MDPLREPATQRIEGASLRVHVLRGPAYSRAVTLVALAKALAGCDPFSPSGPCSPDPGPAEEVAPLTVDRPTVTVGGSTASCSSPVAMAWRNLTTGQGGTVAGSGDYRDERVCVLFTCWVVRVCRGTSFSVAVPLAIGPNLIEYTATQGCFASLKRWTVTRIPDTTPPAVAAAMLSDAPGSTTASVSFSEEVDCATADAVSLSREGVGPLPVRRTCTGAAIELQDFETVPLGRYTLSVSRSLADLAGNGLAEPFALSVLVRAPGPPALRSVVPADGATGVAIDAVVAATFDLPVDPATASALRLLAGAAPVPGRATVDGPVVTFRPDRPLDGQTLYTAELTTALAGIDGQRLAAPASWTFRTADTLPPQVASVRPDDGALNVDPDGLVLVDFSEEVRVGPGGFTLTGPGGEPVAGDVEMQLGQLRFRPASPLAPGVTFTATVGAAVTDLAGNALASPRRWSFTTVGAGVGTWQPMSSVGAPSPRRDFAWAWTGTELLVWGGVAIPGGGYLSDGARYDPAKGSEPAFVAMIARRRIVDRLRRRRGPVPSSPGPDPSSWSGAEAGWTPESSPGRAGDTIRPPTPGGPWPPRASTAAFPGRRRRRARARPTRGRARSW